MKQGKQWGRMFNGLELAAITLYLHPRNYFHNISRNTSTKIFVRLFLVFRFIPAKGCGLVHGRELGKVRGGNQCYNINFPLVKEMLNAIC
jgi:hypothetical protein